MHSDQVIDQKDFNVPTTPGLIIYVDDNHVIQIFFFN